MNPGGLNQRARWPLASLLLLALAVTWMLADAAVERAAQADRAPQVQCIVRLLGVADLALSSSSRWLRHPSITEPGGAFADGPAILDHDPAGAVIGPPHEVWRAASYEQFGPPPLGGKR